MHSMDGFTEDADNTHLLKSFHGEGSSCEGASKMQVDEFGVSPKTFRRHTDTDAMTRTRSCDLSPRLSQNRTGQYPTIPSAYRFIESHYCAPNMQDLTLSTEELRRHNVLLPSRLPAAVWYVLAKSLGIKLSANDKPHIAMFLHIFTIAAALAYAIPGAWYTVCDISSKHSKTTVVIGSLQIVIGFVWACMGVYAHKLAGHLFSNKNFVECVRVHSKTFLKIRTSWLTFLLGLLVTGVNCYEAVTMFYDDSCERAQTDPLVCKVFLIGRVVCTAVTLVWNCIVAYVLFSVCRTHTIAIRRFMRELILDGQTYESFCAQQLSSQKNGDDYSGNKLEVSGSWFLWDDDDDNDAAAGQLEGSQEDVTSQGVFLHSIQGRANRRVSFPLQETPRRPHFNSVSINSEMAETEDGKENSGDDCETFVPSLSTGVSPVVKSQKEEPFDEDWDKLTQASQASLANRPIDRLLSNEDLLYSHWKFVRRLCVTSRYLQRWLASWIAFVVVWDSCFIIYWTKHSASLLGIVEFMVPLFLLLLVSSAYAEVNAEGQRVPMNICPLRERLDVISFFIQQPLQVRVFSFALTYNAIMTVVLGFIVAFASRIILDEVQLKP